MTPAEIRHYKNLGAEAERKAVRKIIRAALADVMKMLEKLDKHVKSVSKRKGGLGRK